MKILALTNLYPPHYLGGYELICHMVLGELAARGHQIQILTSNHAVPGRACEERDERIERTMRLHGFYGHAWLNIARLRHLERHNNERLRAAIREHSPDLVYVWNLGGLSKSMIFTLQTIGIPTVYYLSDHWIARGITADVWLNWWNRKNNPVARAAQKVGLRAYWQRIAPTNPPHHAKFLRLYFCSKALRKLTASAGFEVMHGAVIYAPVDVRKFSGAPKSSALKKLLWVGRLSRDKGIMTALQAMLLLKGKLNVALHVYGKGDADYVLELKRFVQQHGLSVIFFSASMEQMPEVYLLHDALLFTSEWPEPFALTPLEAMASGLPVISTITGGSRELFRHHDNALTFKAGQPDELAVRILELESNPGLRLRIAQTGQDEVRKNYSLPLIVDQIEAYLADSVANWKVHPLPHYTA